MAGKSIRAEESLYSPPFSFDQTPRPLHDYANWANGLAFKNINFSSTGLPVVKIAEVKAGLGPDTKRTNDIYDDSIRLDDGDLLFCWSGQPDSSIGTFRWWDGPAWLNQHIFKVTPADDVSFDYLHALLRCLQPRFIQIARNKQTTGLGHVTKGDLRQLMVQVPDRPEQDRITAVINPLDERIELNRRMAATLESIAQALFKSWFVDFDPVLANAEGRDTALPKEVAALFPASFASEGLPTGWKFGSLDQIVEINPSTKLRAGVTAKYVDMAALPTRSARIKTWIERPAASGARFMNGDTLIARITPCLENGKTAYVDILEDGQVAWGSTEFIVLRPKLGTPRPLPA